MRVPAIPGLEFQLASPMTILAQPVFWCRFFGTPCILHQCGADLVLVREQVFHLPVHGVPHGHQPVHANGPMYGSDATQNGVVEVGQPRVGSANQSRFICEGLTFRPVLVVQVGVQMRGRKDEVPNQFQ